MGNKSVKKPDISISSINSLNIVLMGNKGTGKTTFLKSIKDKVFTDKYTPTIGADYFSIEKSMDKTNLSIEFWDLPGDHKYQSIFSRYSLASEGLIVMYDHTSSNPTEDIITWIEHFIKPYEMIEYSQPIPVLILQNKIDLLEITPVDEHQQLIDEIEVKFDGKVKVLSSQISIKDLDDRSSILDELISEIMTIIANRDSTNMQKKTEKKFDFVFCRSTYLLSFHMDYGPIIIAKSEPNFLPNFSHDELSYAVKLYSILDFDDLIKYGFRLGMSPWPITDSSMFYLAFVIENQEIRGGYDMFIIGASIQNEVSNLMSSYHHTLEGCLLNTMNAIAPFLENFEAEIFMENNTISVNHSKNASDLIKPLELLQKNVNNFLFSLLYKENKV